jgi:antitoxin component YwqK of YwqJK toxin-antitoxin module
MRHHLITFFLILLLIGCKTAPVNQKVNKKRVGLWIEQYEIDSTKYKSVGKYKNGDPIKKWHYYSNDAINKKEIYRKNKCTVTYYHPNGNIQSKGKTKLTITGPEMHWFYFGDWKYYDENGKLISIKKYENGEFVSEAKMEMLVEGKIKTIKK